MSIFQHLEEVGESMSNVRTMCDKVLDVYDPQDEYLNNLLKELSDLQNELEQLDRDFEALLATNEV
jgi:peptidoglycan hydrolase CwlO-like protein